LGNLKGTQENAGADKGRFKGYILHPSAVKVNCKSFCEVDYANFGQWRSTEIWLGVGLHASCPVAKYCRIFKEQKFAGKIFSCHTLQYIQYIVLYNLPSF